MKFRVLIFLNLSLFSIFNARYNKALQIVQLFIPENKTPFLIGVDKTLTKLFCTFPILFSMVSCERFSDG